LIERIVFSRADLVAGGNNDNLEFALRNGALRAKSTVFPVGKLIHPSHLVEPALRAIDPVVRGLSGCKAFVYVGRLIETKFPDDVVRAFADIHRRDERTALVMVGDGTMGAQLAALAKEMGLEERISFVGSVNQQRLSEILAGCFAALSPLTGRALIEVALAGLPVVAYDRDWQKEFVESSRGGIAVPFRNWREMGAAAINLLARPDTARSMGSHARRKALELCDLTQLYKHEREAYEKLFHESA
jgi:glycosyltransferase involved in cell wall biosynthesis